MGYFKWLGMSMWAPGGQVGQVGQVEAEGDLAVEQEELVHVRSCCKEAL